MHNYILEALNRGQYEALDVEGRAVVDVSAGFSKTAVYFLERGAKFVVALEPCPNAFKEMLAHLTLNGLLDKVAAINADVGGKSSYRTLLCPNPIKAPLISLDRFLKLLPAGIVVKMDCKGCEYEALTSASNDDLRKVDEWSIEYHGSPKPLVKKLEASGFEVCVKGPWTWSVGFIHAKKP
jgi:FkbM family methyltransferase